MDGRVTPHGCRGVNSPHPPIDLSSNTSAQFNKSYGRAHATTVGTATTSGNQATFRDAGGGTTGTATGNLAAFLQALEKQATNAGEALQRLAEGVAQADIARTYGVSQATISRLAAPNPF